MNLGAEFSNLTWFVEGSKPPRSFSSHFSQTIFPFSREVSLKRKNQKVLNPKIFEKRCKVLSS